ncbi:hypothetical protein [Streptomyces sp. NPDC055107]
MAVTRKTGVTLTPAAEVALNNIAKHTYGTQDANYAISRALVIYWRIMEAQERGEELRTRQVGGGRTKPFTVDSDKVPQPYDR